MHGLLAYLSALYIPFSMEAAADRVNAAPLPVSEAKPEVLVLTCEPVWPPVASPTFPFSHADRFAVPGIQGTFPPQSLCISGPLCLGLFFLSTCFIVSSL